MKVPLTFLKIPGACAPSCAVSWNQSPSEPPVGSFAPRSTSCHFVPSQRRTRSAVLSVAFIVASTSRPVATIVALPVVARFVI